MSTDETGILAREFIDPIVCQAASAQASVAELQSFTLDQLATGRATYLQFTQRHLGTPIEKRLLLEKDPGLTPDLPLPLRLFPEARVLFPLRDPRDVCVSYFFNLIPLNRVSAAAMDLRSTCESCAHSLRSWQQWRQVLPHPWIETRYEGLVARPELEIRRLLDFLGLPWNDRPLRFHERPQHEKGVRTPTYADVAQPLYQRAVGRWKHYERYLAPHLEILAPWLRAFGYR